MDEDDTLLRLQGLQADLTAFSESRLPNLERLWAELEGSIADFKKLLDKQEKSDGSRQALKNPTITIDDVQYSINEEFRNDVIQVADELNLDELEAAKLYLQSQETAEQIDRPPALASIYRFHNKRESLLQCLRLSVQQAIDLELEAQYRDVFVEVVRLVIQGDEGNPNHAWKFWRKCVTSMQEMERWLLALQTRLDNALVIGRTRAGYALEALEFEKQSLLKQHESLGAIICHLAKDGQATIEDFRFLMDKVKILERLDETALHYVPVLISCASYFGPHDSVIPLTDCRGLDQTFADTSDASRWKLHDFRAAVSTWWLAESSGRYIDTPSGPELQNVDLEAEAESRAKRFMDAIKDGAFEFMLLICSQIRADQWHDPAKAQLVSYLLAGVDRSPRNGALTASIYFQELVAQHMQLFVDAFISNMPDTIRKLKSEEDEQRRNMGARSSLPPHEIGLHLERFLLIIAYAFQGFPDAAKSFWEDPDGNLYGFLTWASKRQSTPRAAAFCEMFRSIAEDAECADAAHKFLLEDASTSSAKLRKGAPLSWVQIFAELSFYAPGLSDRTMNALSQGDGMSGVLIEPESEMMLECYLRLVAHMCRTSANARVFVIGNPTLHLHEVLLELTKAGISFRLRACCFSTLASMLTEKEQVASIAMWDAVDAWMYDIPTMKQLGKTLTQNNLMVQKGRFEEIASGFDEANAFAGLIQDLTSASVGQTALGDVLPFSEQLGMAYRMPGIDQYIDFVLGRIFKDIPQTLPDINQVWELRANCLDLIVTCLATFNEDLVIFANSTNLSVDAAISTSSLSTYVRLHPFARTMEWLFNDGVAKALFASTHEALEDVTTSDPRSPRIVALCRGITVIDLVLKLQSTYFDIVRPVVKMQAHARDKTVANPALASFEDVILGHVQLIVDLGLYCGTGHTELTLLSLQLLQKLATARKLAIASGTAHAGSRVLAALQSDFDVDRVAACFIGPLELDPRELEVGESATAVAVKQGILDLLNNSLDASANRPALAHCLLGFRCGERSITIPPDGLFAKGGSLFHAVAKLSAETLALDQANSATWLSAIRRTSCQILQKLARSPLTQGVILDELRESGYTETAAVLQQAISPESFWCGRTCADPEFLISDGSTVFRDFLVQRAAFFEQSSLELRATVQRNSPTLRQKIISSLLGITSLSTQEEVPNASVFELFDFIDLEIAPPFSLNERRFFGDIDFGICKTANADRGTIYDLKLVKELLLLREAELRKDKKLEDANTLQQCSAEEDALMLCLQSENQYASIMLAQRFALNAWVQLVSLVMGAGDFERASKTALVLQALQIILPKLDKALAEDAPITLPLAKLTYTLVRSVDTTATDDVNNQESTAANDRLRHAFSTGLRGISSASGSSEVRETCYQVVCHYLKAVAIPAGRTSMLPRQAAKAVEHGGERLIDTVCEDALSSQGNCRISALMTIGACVQLFHTVKSGYLIKSLNRLNFISVVVDGIRGIAAEFQGDRPPQDLAVLLTYVHTGLAVLLRMSQTHEGATAILEAGLFSSIRDSQLFATDPDIGLDVDNAEALEKFYCLLTAMLRVMISIVVTKGPRNLQMIAQGRNFLAENRQCMQGVFKAANRGSEMPLSTQEALEDVVDCFTILIHTTGFLEADDEKPVGQRVVGHMFT